MSGKTLSTQSAHSDATTKGAVTREQMTAWIEQLVTRRGVLAGAATIGVAGLAGLILGGCEGDPGATGPAGPAGPAGPTPAAPPEFNFKVVSLNRDDKVTIPEGHSAQVLYAYGDPISSELDVYSNMGTEPALQWDKRAGDHHDGMHFFGLNDNDKLDPNASNRGILCINHENITQSLMHESGTSLDADRNRTDIDEVRKEQRAHGVSCVEVVRDEATGRFTVVQNSPFNRRITALTEMDLHGPAAGSDLLKTRYSNDGLEGRGTLNNCANGYTPWGTYLTCEENYDLYFRDDRTVGDGSKEVPSEIGYANYLAGIGVRDPEGRYEWATLAGHADEQDDEFGRFNVTPMQGESATADYRNEGNQFGYIVEIDPLKPTAAPRKRTALGRFAHEGVWPAKAVDGEPVVFYMGDDDQLQFIYKFVSAATYGAGNASTSPLDTGDTYLDDGTLYVARFDADALTGRQTGAWLPLRPDNPVLQAASEGPNSPFYGLFGTLAFILVNTRAAAFVLGATPMDRPEWGAVNPGNGEVYFTLTNNSDRRGFDDADPLARAAGDRGSRDEVTEFLADREFGAVPANPRGPNSHGHIIRLRENGNDPAAPEFAWDIFVFGSDAGGSANFSGLSADNEFTDCDGLWFDSAGLLWIQTDGGQPDGNHNQMLAAVPGEVDDGGIDAGNNDVSLRRFLVGPEGCEITGIDMTPDRRSMFVNIQHPNGHWPADSRDATEVAAMGRARSATIVITRDDVGPLGTDA